MLERPKVKNCTFVLGKAEKLPFHKGSFDYVIVGFGLRNFSDLNKALSEVRRVLKKDGIFISLEFSEINSIMRKLFYFFMENLFQNMPVYY